MKFPNLDVDKRDRDEPTDTLIKSLLDEEKATKKQKKGDVRQGPAAAVVAAGRKGKTLAEIEEEEGGPVKESLVGMAQTKRAMDRKKREAADVGDTEVATHTERFEQDALEVEEEDGIKFEPFNLKQEREEGAFDEDGNYVFRKQEDEEERDAWLDAEDVKVVSEEVRRKIEEQRAKAEAAARRGPLTERQIAQRKADMAAVMQPEETVTRALKRLGTASGTGPSGPSQPRAMGKREKARLLAQQQAAAAAAATAAGADAASASAASEAAAGFARLTEIADELLEEGELDIYGATTEELIRSARMWLPHLAAPAPGQPGPGPAAAGSGQAGPSGSGAPGSGSAAPAQTAAAAAAAEDDDDDDMFADAEEGGAVPRAGAAAAGGAAAGASAGAGAAADADEDMFGDDEEGAGGAGAAASGTGRGQEPPQGAAPAAAVSARQEGASNGGGPHVDARPGPGPGSDAAAGKASGGASEPEVDYASWPVKELKRLLQERGVDPSGFVEKGDLVARVKEVVAAAAAAGGGTGGGAQGGGAPAGGGAFDAPAGYVFDPSSGYFFSEESGMYYDTSSGGYCQAATGKWYWLDAASGSFVEWKQR